MVTPELREQAMAWLKINNTMVVATVSKNSEPQAATVYFDVDDDFNFYFITSGESAKAVNLESNGRAAFVVGFGPQLITVQGQGKVEKVPMDLESFSRILNRLAPENLLNWPLLKINKGGFVGFKIKPDWLVWLNLDKEGHPQIYSAEYRKLI